MSAPKIVLDLSASVGGGTPLAWKEYDDKWVIVVADGRKFTFKKDDLKLPRRRETTQNYAPGVQAEAKRPPTKKQKAAEE
jgi:hypothetical protein